MAKRKNAVALFEVITATRRKEAAAAERPPGAAGTSKWWFARRSRPAEPTAAAAATPAPDPNDPTAGVILTPVYAPIQFASPVSASEPAPIPTAAAVPAVVHRVLPAASYPAPVERVASPPQSLPRAEIPSADRPRRAWFGFGFGFKKLGLDPTRPEVTLRFRYTTAIIAGFAVLVIVGLAYVSGRRSRLAAAPPSNSRSTEQIQQGDVFADVLQVGDDRTTTIDTAPRGDDRPLPEVGSVKGPGPGAAQPPAPGGAQRPAGKARVSAAFEVDMPRTIGLNYVIIQSYPKREDADAARQALGSAGIPCTVERAPKGWSANPKLWSVIGTYGFPRIRKVKEYEAYLDSIMAVSAKHAGKNKYRKFEPAPCKWQQ